MLVDLPTRPDPEGHSAAGEPVDRGGAFGEQRRMMDRRGRHQRPDPNPLGDSRQGGKKGPALVYVSVGGRRVAGVGHVVVGQPSAVPPGILSCAHLLQEVSGSTAIVGPERELHRTTLEPTPIAGTSGW